MHFFMNPLDIRYLDQNPDVKQGSVLEDFVTRMVGSTHGIRPKTSRENCTIYNIQKNLRTPMQRVNLLRVCAERVVTSIQDVVKRPSADLMHVSLRIISCIHTVKIIIF